MPVINTKNYDYIFVIRYFLKRFYSQEMISERKEFTFHFVYGDDIKCIYKSIFSQ